MYEHTLLLYLKMAAVFVLPAELNNPSSLEFSALRSFCSSCSRIFLVGTHLFWNSRLGCAPQPSAALYMALCGSEPFFSVLLFVILFLPPSWHSSTTFVMRCTLTSRACAALLFCTASSLDSSHPKGQSVHLIIPIKYRILHLFLWNCVPCLSSSKPFLFISILVMWIILCFLVCYINVQVVEVN